MSASGIHRTSPGPATATSAGDTPRPSATQESPRQQTPAAPEGLRQRPPSATADPAASMARRVGLPTAVEGTRETVLPTLSTITSAITTSVKAVKQFMQPVVSSAPLQSALRSDLAQGDAQLGAHDAALAYGKGSATWLDRAVPLAHSVLRQGLTTTSAEVDRASASASASLFSRMAAGQAGDLLSRKLVGPLIDLLPRQFTPIDARAVVPDQIVRDMNALVPQSGDKLRAAVSARQAEIVDLGSASNTTLAKLSAGAVNSARVAVMSTTPLGVAGQVGLDLGASAATGGIVGGVMAMRQSVATLTVPDAKQLSALVDTHPRDGAQALAQLMASTGGEQPSAHKVPLFFARHIRPPVDPAAAAPSGNGHAAVADPGQRARMASFHETLAQGIGTLPPEATKTTDATARPTGTPTARPVEESDRGADPRTAMAIGSAVGAHAAMKPLLAGADVQGH